MNPVFPAMKRLVHILPLFVLAAARAAAEPVVPALPEDGCVRSGAGRVLEDRLSGLDPDDPEAGSDRPRQPSAAPARAEDPATEDSAFFLDAFSFVRGIASRSGAECHVQELHSRTLAGREGRGTELGVTVTVPFVPPPKDRFRPDKASATLFLGLVGTNGVDFAAYGDEERPADGGAGPGTASRGRPSPGTAVQACVRPDRSNGRRAVHWTDGTLYTVLAYRARNGFQPFADVWTRTTNALARREAALPSASPAATPPDALETDGLRLCPALPTSLADAGLEQVWACFFFDRRPYYDGSVLARNMQPVSSAEKRREWWLKLQVRSASPATVRPSACAQLFYGDADGKPFAPDSFQLRSGDPASVRTWTDGDRFLVLAPEAPFRDDPAWDAVWTAATNLVRSAGR